MANLKHLKNRIRSIKSTQKITKAMQMVAASKLRHARVNYESSIEYADELRNIISRIVQSSDIDMFDIPMLTTSQGNKNHLFIIISSDRGLCGSFNSSVAKILKTRLKYLATQNATAKIICLGRKGYELIKHGYQDDIIARFDNLDKKGIKFEEIKVIAHKILEIFYQGSFGYCSIFYNKFKSVISQEAIFEQILPVNQDQFTEQKIVENIEYDYEPDAKLILSEILPKNFIIQIYQALLESATSEHAARMTSMDNATKNAGEMIKDLTLVYNRTRQSTITKELIEIISGAEAL